MKILVITSARFPNGDAESVRLHTMGRLLRDIGHDVSYVGLGFDDYLKKSHFDDFEVVSLRKKTRSKVSKIYYYINYNKRLKSYLSKYLKVEKIDFILYADLIPWVINMLKIMCKKNNIQLITDSVEWYSPEQFKAGTLSPAMILKDIENKYSIDKTIKVICISKYLYSHFTNKGCKCIRIPVILDVVNMSYSKNIDFNKLTILYAGSPGKKDYVVEMLRGILLLGDQEIEKLKFVLAGVNINDIKNQFGAKEIQKLTRCVMFLGRVERETVLQKLSEADFTVLLRSDNQRYSKAGFPTKVVESLATGTPVILNLTSDLGDYINDMEEGLIVENCSAIAFSATLKCALGLSSEQREFMRNKARVCAERYFDYREYEKEIQSLFENN